MKLVVSDYDGTLNPDSQNLKILKENIKAIRQFRKEKNKFMLATGRTFASIVPVLEKQGIPFDYLSCNDGSVLYDKDLNLLYASTIDSELATELEEIITTRKIGKQIEEDYVYEKDAPRDKILNLIVTSHLFGVLKDASSLKRIIESYPGLTVTTFFLFHQIRNAGGKERAIRALEQKESFSRIVTVGDGTNDISMLKSYEGYKVALSYPSLYGKGIKTVSSVKSLVKTLLSE